MPIYQATYNCKWWSGKSHWHKKKVFLWYAWCYNWQLTEEGASHTCSILRNSQRTKNWDLCLMKPQSSKWNVLKIFSLTMSQLHISIQNTIPNDQVSKEFNPSYRNWYSCHTATSWSNIKCTTKLQWKVTKSRNKHICLKKNISKLLNIRPYDLR